jgi:hypothetical protein
LKPDRDPRRLKETTQNQATLTDLARLEIADWLASSPDGPTHRQNARTDDQDTTSESTIKAIDQVTALAEEVTKATWCEIAKQLDRTTEARDIKRNLANHGWCDLLVGLVRAIEACRETLDSIPEAAKKIVKHAILNSSIQGTRPHVTETVADAVVEKVWQAFKTALFVKVPLLNITNDETLRALRILAVFVCPAPEKHEEVRKHALVPLGDDAKGILTDQTRKRLAQLFSEWRNEDQPSDG